MSKQRVCYRCQLREMGDTDQLRSMETARARLHEEDMAEDTLYEERLAVCKDCGSLLDGTCLKCGCYVELRAAMKRAQCPDVPRRW